MRLPFLLLLVLGLLPLTGCGGGGGSGGGGSSSSSSPSPTTTSWAAGLTTDTMGDSFNPIGETDTTATIQADGTVDIQTAKLGRIVRASGSEWYGGPGSAWLLRLTYDATAKTIELRRVVTGQRVVWTLTPVPSGAG